MACQMFTTGSLLHGNWRRNLILNLWEHCPVFPCLSHTAFQLCWPMPEAPQWDSFSVIHLYIRTRCVRLSFFFFPRQSTARSSNNIILKLTIALTICDQLKRKWVKGINENILKCSQLLKLYSILWNKALYFSASRFRALYVYCSLLKHFWKGNEIETLYLGGLQKYVKIILEESVLGCGPICGCLWREVKQEQEGAGKEGSWEWNNKSIGYSFNYRTIFII